MKLMSLPPEEGEKDTGPPIEYKPPYVLSAVFAGLFVLLLIYGFLA